MRKSAIHTGKSGADPAHRIIESTVDKRTGSPTQAHSFFGSFIDALSGQRHNRAVEHEQQESLLEEFVNIGERAKAADHRGDVAQARLLYQQALEKARQLPACYPRKESVDEVVQRFRQRLRELTTSSPSSAPPYATSQSAGVAQRRRSVAAGGAGRGAATRPPAAAGAGAAAQQVDEMERKIEENIMESTGHVAWDDIVGLDLAKSVLMETIVLPTLNPSVFTGLRTPPKGVLLFGPPGNGKTFIARAVASQCRATFFTVSASSLTSRWFGEGEKLVRALFAVARKRQPSVVFIDEVDSLLSARSQNEHDAMRRLKTEFLIAFDGVTSSKQDRILVLGATNRPMDLDEAALRRFPKRIFIPLPEPATRKALIMKLLGKNKHDLKGRALDRLVADTDGYSASDLTALCSEASLGPIREYSSDPAALARIRPEQLRAIKYYDFESALQMIRPSVSKDALDQLVRWNEHFGAYSPG
ncbi:unnamed protein product [Vitrella brassicaformis CCMP3155]|uniref:microtubule-severing ATPase n=1 Tax=Vitrella brassicaformis (strain CCMP3155) TaxID=1169540 RepID=A0A0G4EFV1_VITBC|nr:unnamed protein product [Vitrella brassicaformis CCMP3155]|eukprot:CEL94577.1 unnamed protein product [Vitrella brassicaformis CCMP3155]